MKCPSPASAALILATFLATLAGCEPTDPADPATGGDNRPEIISDPPVLMPASLPTAATADSSEDSPPAARRFATAKPGHWVGVSTSMQSTRSDRRGELRIEAISATGSQDDGLIDDLALTPAVWPARATSAGPIVTRTAVLPRNQRRRLDARVLLPPPRSGKSPLRIASTYRDAATALSIAGPATTATPMAAATYHLVVLTQRPNRFASLATADWVSPPRGPVQFNVGVPNYEVVLPGGEGVLPIGRSVLEWSSTAVLWWHDLPPESLTPDQWTAIDNWLHFGGRLVVDGPAAAAAIAAGPHPGWLPIDDPGNVELNPDEAIDWAKSMSVADDPSLPSVAERLNDGSVRVALGAGARPTARWIGLGQMVAGHRVGRGTVIQSRVDLISDWTDRWRSFDSFVNGAVLGRPGRTYETYREDSSSPQSVSIKQSYVIQPTTDWSAVTTASPHWNTNVRWLSRDAVLPPPTADLTSDPAAGPVTPWSEPTARVDPVGGLGMFSAASPIVAAAGRQLRGGVGVSIPSRERLTRSLLIYLGCLIPLNYVFFRLLDRLHWAWVAIVPIAIGGAILMTRSASVDIGLVRTRHEWALLELPVDHSRAHLTRVIGIYNSLASTYVIDGPGGDMVIDPIASSSAAGDEELFGTQDAEVRLGRSGGASLAGWTVPSNAYRAVHIEQIVDAGGTVSWQTNLPTDEQPPRVTNRSDWTFADAWVVARTEAGTFQIAALGNLPPGGQRVIDWDTQISPRIPAGIPAVVADWLRRLTHPANLSPGQTRLVGRVEGTIEGLSIDPPPTDSRVSTLVVCHLTAPPMPPPSIDENLPPISGTAEEPAP